MAAGRRLTLAVLLLSSAALAQEPGPPPPAPPAPTAPAPSVAPPPAAPAPPPPATPPAAAPAPQPYPYPYPPYPYPYPYLPPPPAQLPFKEGDRVPDGYHTESRVRRGPIIAGATLGGSTYLINLLVASVASRGEDRGRVALLYVPGVGTWGYVGDACDSDGDDGCSFVILHSAAHTVGVALFVYGFAAPRTVLVRNDVSLTLTPTIGRAGSALSLGGSF
ncbi:MAG: hypothetical protein IT377_09330 [Polyangiaceae bacterium]|nr:hypothetical protein [Polyangiaceae bacterium]